jgi:glycosyltransferase involved in cell wall biosynthesis
MTDARLSLIIPVHNRRKYLRQSVESVLREDVEGLEVIVVDDGSTDGSLETVSDLPIVPLGRPVQGGSAAALNTGLRRAKGKHVGFLGSDDVLVPGGLHWRLDFLERNPTAKAVAGTLQSIVDEEGHEVPELKRMIEISLTTPPPVITHDYIKHGGVLLFPGAVTMLRRDIVDKVGFFDEDLMTGEDRDYLYRLLSLTDVYFFHRPVFIGRLDSKKLTWRFEDADSLGDRRSRAEGLLMDLAHGIEPLTDPKIVI